jgi:hypothetical protein
MTTKDYIYLGLILLTAFAFYCNGFYAGVYRCKRMYDTLLDDAEVDQDAAESSPQDAKIFAIDDKDLAYRVPENVLSKRELRGDFGKN